MKDDRAVGRHTVSAMSAVLAVLLAGGPARAQQSLVAVDIAAKPLAAALTELAQETGVNVLFSPEAVRDLQSTPVNARVSPEEAARLLLAGTSLDVLKDPSGALIVRERTSTGAAAATVPSAKSAATAGEEAADRSTVEPPASGARPADPPPGGERDAAPRPAAPPGTQAATALDEVVVTAQKRQESLQDTPISIAVLGGEALDNRGVAAITDLVAGAVPSLRIAPLAGRVSSYNLGMRGIVPSDSSQISRDPTVGIYVDGIYLGRTQGLGTELFDVERIEVLRGPQGTLFGRNAVGGALSIVTRRPSGVLGGQLRVGASNFDGRRARGHLDLPQFAGISMKLEGSWTERDGIVDNPLAGQWDFSEYRRHGLRVSTLWEPAANFDVLYAFDKSRDESPGMYAHISRLLPGAPPLAPMFSLEPDRVDRARAGVLLGPSVAQVEGHGLNVNWNLSDAVSLRSITGYRELEQSQFDNFSGSFLAFRPNGSFARASLADVKQDQFSQEFQLVGSAQRLKYVLGAFYFDEDAEDSAFATTTARFNATGTDYTIIPLPANPVADRASTSHADSRALYGQATWTPAVLADRLHLTGGLRWTHDKKNGRLLSIRGVPSPLAFTFESKRTDPSATAAFDWTEDVNTYLRWGTAYRAGGANSRSETFRTFAEEEVETWEVGLKADLFDRRARLNVAMYHTDYRDRQSDFRSPLNPSATETVNAADKATISGVELDLSVRPLPGLTLTGSYSYTDGDIPPDVNPFTSEVTPISLVLTPENAATFAVDYQTARLGIGSLLAHVDVNYSGGFRAYATDATLTSYVLVNGRLTLGEIQVGSSSTLAVSLWGKNLTNEKFDSYDFDAFGLGLTGGQLAYYNEPRTWGLDVEFKF